MSRSFLDIFNNFDFGGWRPFSTKRFQERIKILSYQEVKDEVADLTDDDDAKVDDLAVQEAPDENDLPQEKAHELQEIANVTEEPSNVHEGVLEALDEIDGGWKSYSSQNAKHIHSSLMCDNPMSITPKEHDGFLSKGGLMGDSVCINEADKVEYHESFDPLEAQIATTKIVSDLSMTDTSVSDDNTCGTLNENISILKGGLMGDSVCIDEAEEEEHDIESAVKTSINAPETEVPPTKTFCEHSIADTSVDDNTCGSFNENSSLLKGGLMGDSVYMDGAEDDTESEDDASIDPEIQVSSTKTLCDQSVTDASIDNNTCGIVNENSSLLKGGLMGDSVCLDEDEDDHDHDIESQGKTSTNALETQVPPTKTVCGTFHENNSLLKGGLVGDSVCIDGAEDEDQYDIKTGCVTSIDDSLHTKNLSEMFHNHSQIDNSDPPSDGMIMGMDLF